MRGAIAMSTFENLLTPGSTELPDCRCGAEMRLFKVRHAEIRKSEFLDVIIVVMNFS